MRWRIVLEGDMPYPVGRIETVAGSEAVPVVVVGKIVVVPWRA